MSFPTRFPRIMCQICNRRIRSTHKKSDGVIFCHSCYGIMRKDLITTKRNFMRWGSLTIENEGIARVCKTPFLILYQKHDNIESAVVGSFLINQSPFCSSDHKNAMDNFECDIADGPKSEQSCSQFLLCQGTADEIKLDVAEGPALNLYTYISVFLGLTCKWS